MADTRSSPTYRCSGCGAINRVRSTDGRTPICGRCKHTLDTTGTPQAVSAAELSKLVAQSPVPILVDFWAPWCPPCRAAAPLLERLARERSGRLITVKVDGDQHPAASQLHRVQSIPTFIVFRDGREATRQTGLLPAKPFAQWLDGQIGGAA